MQNDKILQNVAGQASGSRSGLSPSDKSKAVPLFWLFFMGLEDKFAQRATIK
jgi:hypothetical protein